MSSSLLLVSCSGCSPDISGTVRLIVSVVTIVNTVTKVTLAAPDLFFLRVG